MPDNGRQAENYLDIFGKYWSGRRDLNLRPRQSRNDVRYQTALRSVTRRRA